jgi:hypothetical protein
MRAYNAAEMLRLDDLIGKPITMVLVGSATTYDVVLHGVENGGLWIESEHFEKLLPSSLKQLDIPHHLVLFFPFAQIHFLVAASIHLEP